LRFNPAGFTRHGQPLRSRRAFAGMKEECAGRISIRLIIRSRLLAVLAPHQPVECGKIGACQTGNKRRRSRSCLSGSGSPPPRYQDRPIPGRR
jgi:hypothetical protein